MKVKFIELGTAEQVCKFIEARPELEILSITWDHTVVTFVVFYKEKKK